MRGSSKISYIVISIAIIIAISSPYIQAQELAVTEVVPSVTIDIPEHPEDNTEHIYLAPTEVEKLRREYAEFGEAPIVYVPEEGGEKRFVLFRWVDLFVDWFKKEPPIKEGSRTQELREQWHEMLGADVFYPIFKAKEAQKYIRKKCSYRICGMRATADYSDGKVWLKFKRKW